MAGYGNDDKGPLTSRQVTRNSGMYSSRETYPNSDVVWGLHEFRPKLGSGELLSERGTRYHWNVIHGDYNRSGTVKSLRAAKAAVRSRARRLTEFDVGRAEAEDEE